MVGAGATTYSELHAHAGATTMTEGKCEDGGVGAQMVGGKWQGGGGQQA